MRIVQRQRHTGYGPAMITDPTPWTGELAAVAQRLEAKTKQTRWTQRTDVLIERDFVVSAYVMSKLLRGGFASKELTQRRIPIRRLEPDASYDLEFSRRDTVSVADLCHRIIRNTAFAFYCGETADLFDGVYVSSDRHDVILVIASDFIALCNDMGTEFV